MNRSIYILLSFFFFSLSLVACAQSEPVPKAVLGNGNIAESPYHYNKQRIDSSIFAHAYLAKEFCKQIDINSRYMLMVDMSVPSGYKRLFLVDTDEDSILYSCMVSHGAGPNDTNEVASGIPHTFSNQEDSHCSSLGRYIIGQRGYSQWGINIKYQLYGLDSTNRNAKNRNIVLHSWEQIPDVEIYPKQCALSWGCPAVSIESMKILDGFLYSQGRQMLLWIYN